MQTTRPVLSVVVPMYDEEEVLPIFFERMRPLLDGLGISYELVVVDDGSRDATAAPARRGGHQLAPAPVDPAAAQQRAPGCPVGRIPAGSR
ncbi:glycosyltransferase [Kribbella qitaiheensis]|uniref:glycosyltransferase n=1 Tax=Kribbella qitaiheensis TaxID=1544730 RepID=UPI002483BB2B|nr:glycosyltransferase [Kribbella qitaiheensis]